MIIVPITQRDAKAFVGRVHRHLSPPRGDVIRAAIEVHGVITGVAMAGRPVSRHLDDGRTLEIIRVAVHPGQNNACSMLYGALRRAATALGWTRIYTYTLESEGGASLRAAGFTRDAVTTGGEWSRDSRPRNEAEQSGAKTRWVWPHTARIGADDV